MNWLGLFRKNLERTRPAQTLHEREHRQLQQQVALAGIASTHPLWMTVLEIVDEHERNMCQRAIEEKLSSEERHYAAGLAASAEYLANALRDLKARAEAAERKRKGD